MRSKQNSPSCLAETRVTRPLSSCDAAATDRQRDQLLPVARCCQLLCPTHRSGSHHSLTHVAFACMHACVLQSLIHSLRLHPVHPSRPSLSPPSAALLPHPTAMSNHTIVLLQTTAQPSSRQYSDFESQEKAMDGERTNTQSCDCSRDDDCGGGRPASSRLLPSAV